MNLLFAIDRPYIPLLLSCLRSIALRGGAERYEVYILHSDLPAEEEDRITAVAGANFSFHFLSVPRQLFSGFPETRRYPVQIYYRLAAPLLLPPELDRVLYLDVDTVVINPLTELYHTGLDGHLFAACSHTREFLQKFNQFRLKLDRDVPYVNTGVMVMNLSLLRQELHLEDIRRFALENQHALMLPDQDILTALYGHRVKVMDTLRYNLSDRVISFHNANPKNRRIDLDWVRDNAVIIHYFGRNKPWNDHYNGILDVFYHQYGRPTEKEA